MHNPSPEHQTMVALLTAPGRSAVATVALSGPKATQAIDAFFRPAGKGSSGNWTIGGVRFGTWGGSHYQLEERVKGEGLVISIIGQNQIEIHCHGGSAAVGRVLHDLQSFGCRIGCGWGWPGKLDPLEFACYRAACEARTELTASIAWKQYQGRLRSSLTTILAQLQNHELVIAQKELQDLQQTATYGLHLTRPWTVGIIGPPNAGKSSLLNAIIGWERAITSTKPGTTRDIVTVETAAEGWPLQIQDTAGIRETSSALELQGILRARQVAQEVDLVLLVVDASQGLTSFHHQWSPPTCSKDSVSRPVLWVWNKADLATIANASSPVQAIPTSATQPFGIDVLLRTLVRKLVPEDTEASLADRGVLLTDEQVEIVNQVIYRIENRDVLAATVLLQDMLRVA